MISLWFHEHFVTTNPVLNEMPDNLSVENVQTDEKEVISRSCKIQRIGSKYNVILNRSEWADRGMWEVISQSGGFFKLEKLYPVEVLVHVMTRCF